MDHLSHPASAPGSGPHEDNRAAWNAISERYERVATDDIALLRAGGTTLHPVELTYLSDLRTWCRRAIHLQCAGGSDTLSLWARGADEVIGVDISERLLDIARVKGEALGARARWVRADILAAPTELDGSADLVYTGKGALCWIMDIEEWGSVVARLLAPGGRLYLYEAHPLTWIWDVAADEPRLDPEFGDYFSEQVAVSTDWPAGYDLSPEQVGDRTGAVRKHERQWTLGQIFSSLLAAGLHVELFHEHPEHYWDQFPHLSVDVARRLPNTFSLVMRKPSARA